MEKEREKKLSTDLKKNCEKCLFFFLLWRSFGSFVEREEEVGTVSESGPSEVVFARASAFRPVLTRFPYSDRRPTDGRRDGQRAKWRRRTKKALSSFFRQVRTSSSFVLAGEGKFSSSLLRSVPRQTRRGQPTQRPRCCCCFRSGWNDVAERSPDDDDEEYPD